MIKTVCYSFGQQIQLQRHKTKLHEILLDNVFVQLLRKNMIAANNQTN